MIGDTVRAPQGFNHAIYPRSYREVQQNLDRADWIRKPSQYAARESSLTSTSKAPEPDLQTPLGALVLSGVIVGGFYSSITGLLLTVGRPEHETALDHVLVARKLCVCNL